MLVSGQGEEGITPIHEVTAEQGVRVHDGGQSVDDRPSMQVNHKEDLQRRAALASPLPAEQMGSRAQCLLEGTSLIEQNWRQVAQYYQTSHFCTLGVALLPPTVDLHRVPGDGRPCAFSISWLQAELLPPLGPEHHQYLSPSCATTSLCFSMVA